MLTGIDHLVIAVQDPDTAAAALERDLGLAFTGGGRHEHAGTLNRLAFLGDTYVELIGVFDRRLVLSNTSFAVGRAALALLDEGTDGLATWAVATDDVAADAVRLRAAGSPIAAPVTGSRMRPDGEEVRWLAAFPVLGPAEPPFLIEHEMTGPEWGDAARAARAASRHPVGGLLRLTGLAIPVADVRMASDRFHEVSGMQADSAGHAVVGGQTVELVSATQAPHPVVTITASEPGHTPPVLTRFGVRWRRVVAAQSA